MKNKNLLIILSMMFIISLISCDSNNSSTVNQAINSISPIDHTEINSKAVIVASLIDISASTVPVINLPDSFQLLQFYRTVASGDKQSGIAIGRIGTPINSDHEFIRFTNLKIPTEQLQGTMSQRKKIMSYNQKAEYVNQLKEKKFLHAFNELKERNDQQTDIETAMVRAIKLLNEPNYSNHLKVLLVISDGYHITKGQRNFQVDFSNATDIKVILVGWKSDINGFKGIAPDNLYLFEGFSNVPDYLKTLLKH
jgi:hypothetical protein